MIGGAARHSVPFWSVQRAYRIESKTEKDPLQLERHGISPRLNIAS
jgi:hypothetical protein